MILPFAPENIECVLLYEKDFGSLDFDGLLDFLNESLKAPGDAFRRGPVGGQADFDMFVGHNMCVLVSHNRAPLAPDGFAEALASSYTAMLAGDAEQKVARHKANVFITVSTEAPITPEIQKQLETMGVDLPRPQQTREMFDTKAAVCRLAAAHVARQNKPALVHWCQSDTLMLPELFLSAAEDKEPTWLYLHPHFFSAGTTEDGRDILGARVPSSAQLIGCSLAFHPVAVPPAFTMQRLTSFVDMVRARGGDLIPDGDSFGKDASEVIRVRHVRAAGAEPGEIELTLERCDEFGIDQPQKPPRFGRTAPETPPAQPERRQQSVPVEVDRRRAGRPQGPQAQGVLFGESPVAADDLPKLQPITRANAPQAVVFEAPKSAGLMGRLRSLIGR